IDAADQPLRTAEREVARDGRVMDHDIHVRLQADIAGHDFLDGLAALGDGSAAVDLLEANDAGLRVIEGGGGLDVLAVEGLGQPMVDELGCGCSHDGISFLESSGQAAFRPWAAARTFGLAPTRSMKARRAENGARSTFVKADQPTIVKR